MPSEVKNPLLVKNGLVVFQNSLLLTKPLCITLPTQKILVVLSKFLQNHFALFIAKTFSLDGHLRYLFWILIYLLFIALLQSSVMKGVLSYLLTYGFKERFNSSKSYFFVIFLVVCKQIYTNTCTTFFLEIAITMHIASVSLFTLV